MATGPIRRQRGALPALTAILVAVALVAVMSGVIPQRVIPLLRLPNW
jgi:hypothetical protein